ncbi:MAG: hypothetical protein ACR2PH_15475 [Desulfobulbia bacterium]
MDVPVLFVPIDILNMRLYNKQMNDDTQEALEPVNVEKLFTEFSDHSVAELMVTIQELRDKVEHEQKLNAAKEFKLQKAEEELALLNGRINSVTTILEGDADICIDCEAVKEQKDTE